MPQPEMGFMKDVRHESFVQGGMPQCVGTMQLEEGMPRQCQLGCKACLMAGGEAHHDKQLGVVLKILHG